MAPPGSPGSPASARYSSSASSSASTGCSPSWRTCSEPAQSPRHARHGADGRRHGGPSSQQAGHRLHDVRHWRGVPGARGCVRGAHRNLKADVWAGARHFCAGPVDLRGRHGDSEPADLDAARGSGRGCNVAGGLLLQHRAVRFTSRCAWNHLRGLAGHQLPAGDSRVRDQPPSVRHGDRCATCRRSRQLPARRAHRRGRHGRGVAGHAPDAGAEGRHQARETAGHVCAAGRSVRQAVPPRGQRDRGPAIAAHGLSVRLRHPRRMAASTT